MVDVSWANHLAAEMVVGWRDDSDVESLFDHCYVFVELGRLPLPAVVYGGRYFPRCSLTSLDGDLLAAAVQVRQMTPSSGGMPRRPTGWNGCAPPCVGRYGTIFRGLASAPSIGEAMKSRRSGRRACRPEDT